MDYFMENRTCSNFGKTPLNFFDIKVVFYTHPILFEADFMNFFDENFDKHKTAIKLRSKMQDFIINYIFTHIQGINFDKGNLISI